MRGGWRGKLPRSSLSSFLVGRDGGATAWPTSNGSHAMTSDSWFPRPFARALNTKDPLAREGLAVVPKDIAGARSEPTTLRIRERSEPINRVSLVPKKPAGLFGR